MIESLTRNSSEESASAVIGPSENPHKDVNGHKSIKVLTFNVFTGKFRLDTKRIENQIEQIRNLELDIICLQEAWDRRVIELYKSKLQNEFDIITSNSNMKNEEHQTLLLGRGGFCQRLCELFLPLLFLLGTVVFIVLYFINDKIKPGYHIMFFFATITLASIFIAVFSKTILKYVWRTLHLPQHGFITGDIMGMMILVRRGRNNSGVEVRYVENSAFAEVFSNQAAKKVWRLFGFVERFFIVKGYLSIDVMVDRVSLGVTNIHFNTGTRNKLRMGQIKELFRKGICKNKPSILCGDANTEADQPEIRWISGRMLDTYAVFHKDTEDHTSRCDGYTWHEQNPLTHQGFLVDKNMRIDYIWFRNRVVESEDSDEILPPLEAVDHGPFTVYDSRVVLDQDPFTSDHFGVSTELRFREN